MYDDIPVIVLFASVTYSVCVYDVSESVCVCVCVCVCVWEGVSLATRQVDDDEVSCDAVEVELLRAPRRLGHTRELV